jgi:hypothetical protein
MHHKNIIGPGIGFVDVVGGKDDEGCDSLMLQPTMKDVKESYGLGRLVAHRQVPAKRRKLPLEMRRTMENI